MVNYSPKNINYRNNFDKDPSITWIEHEVSKMFAHLFFTCLSGVRVVHVVKLQLSTFLVQCCDVHNDFHVK